MPQEILLDMQKDALNFQNKQLFYLSNTIMWHFIPKKLHVSWFPLSLWPDLYKLKNRPMPGLRYYGTNSF